ncbi:AraC family transcriptional regulator [Leptospira sp. 201903070]|uniref:AraC family transcriptional regulator n=1 Tax=Leptospira ainlahdjerensis TaxID=2810033 RepID=A0ABS2UF25_9LEPT|nr:helix-turn-helix domain-containing protein [Leptospira ainlahdjerensis]MBM9578153.1 AraC family transcriptional regulator [Leptospira ainlahdjerensis]
MFNLNLLSDIMSFAGFSEVNLFYTHAAGVGTGMTMAISRLYGEKRNEFSKAYGTILLSVSVFLMTNNKILFPQETDPRLLKDPVELGFYFGLVLYACSAVLICVKFLLGEMENPWFFCKRMIGILPLTILLSFLIPSVVYICLCDGIAICIVLYTFVWSCVTIYKTRKERQFYHFPFIIFLISVSLFLDFTGTILQSTKILLFSELIPGILLAYVTLLERIYPFLFHKVNGELKAEEMIIAKDIPNESPGFFEEEDSVPEPSRNILEGVELSKIEERVQAFLQIRGYADEELRLPDFASYLGLSTHQASYYINKHMSMKFADFLNMHRIEDVKRNLKNKSHMNLLQIALECGFNSASSFHRACVKFTGKSPREFRKLVNSQN